MNRFVVAVERRDVLKQSGGGEYSRHGGDVGGGGGGGGGADGGHHPRPAHARDRDCREGPPHSHGDIANRDFGTHDVASLWCANTPSFKQIDGR